VPARGLLRIVAADYELLDLIELMDPQQAADVSATTARLPMEARREASVEQRKISLGEELLPEADRPDRCRNEKCGLSSFLDAPIGRR
jgi:hypothetical protein